MSEPLTVQQLSEAERLTNLYATYPPELLETLYRFAETQMYAVNRARILQKFENNELSKKYKGWNYQPFLLLNYQ